MKTGKRIWITGASSGIGRALALHLAGAGNDVVASARNANALADLHTEFISSSAGQASSGSIVPVVFDVTTEPDSDAIWESIGGECGAIDVCIVCAGCCEYVEDVMNLDINLFRRVYDTNVFGALRTAKTAIPLLANSFAQSGSRAQLLVVSSLSTVLGFSRAEAYASSKAALSYLTHSLRLDLAPLGIDVTLVNPGFVKTPMSDRNDFSMPFLMPVDKAVTRIVRALKDRPLQLDFPRRLYWALKFFSILPGLWYRWIGPGLAKNRNKRMENPQ